MCVFVRLYACIGVELPCVIRDDDDGVYVYVYVCMCVSAYSFLFPVSLHTMLDSHDTCTPHTRRWACQVNMFVMCGRDAIHTYITVSNDRIRAHAMMARDAMRCDVMAWYGMACVCLRRDVMLLRCS